MDASEGGPRDDDDDVDNNEMDDGGNRAWSDHPRWFKIILCA